jgi:hypothetical protein
MQLGVGSAANQVFVRWCEINRLDFKIRAKLKTALCRPRFYKQREKVKTPAHFSFNKYHLKLASLSYNKAGFPATAINCFVSISFYLTNTRRQLFGVSMETHI